MIEYVFVSQTSPGQLTIHSCLNPNKPLRSNPLAPLLHDNSAADTSKQSEGIRLYRIKHIYHVKGVLLPAFFFLWLVKDADEQNTPKQGNADKQILNCSHNDPTVPQKDSGTKKQTKSGKRINGEKSTDRKYV